MRTMRTRAAIALAAGLVGVTAAAGCASPADEPAETTGTAAASAPGGQEPADTPSGTGTGAERSSNEQAFLDDLAGRGVATDTAADTAVEVGLGICRGIAEGADPETVLDSVRPFTTALAARDGDGGADAADVGRALVDASRSHLCG